MSTLIACLSSGKGTWVEVTKIIRAQKWDKIFLIANDFGKEKFSLRQDNIYFIMINTFQDTSLIVKEIKKQLTGKINDFEAALNFISGSGKEHQALLEAVLELGLNFRLVTFENNRLEVLGLKI